MGHHPTTTQLCQVDLVNVESLGWLDGKIHTVTQYTEVSSLGKASVEHVEGPRRRSGHFVVDEERFNEVSGLIGQRRCPVKILPGGGETPSDALIWIRESQPNTPESRKTTFFFIIEEPA